MKLNGKANNLTILKVDFNREERRKTDKIVCTSLNQQYKNLKTIQTNSGRSSLYYKLIFFITMIGGSLHAKNEAKQGIFSRLFYEKQFEET